MAIFFDGKEIERLREIYPEIPESVIGLKITLGVDSVTEIECTFNPVAKVITSEYFSEEAMKRLAK